MDQKLAPETLCNHPEFSALPPDNRPLTPPIYQSVKFSFDSFAELKRVFKGEREGYFYARHGHPTIRVLETTLASLQGTEDGRCLATGLSAISGTLLGLLKSGDRLIYFIESYRAARVFAESVLQRYGVETVRLSLDDSAGIERELAVPGTKAILLEAISNPQLKAAPLDRIHAAAKKHGVITILDNTLCGFQSWAEWPFDLYVHSLTKYAGGHGDVMGGAILGRTRLLKALDRTLNLTGSTLDPHAAFLIQRGLKTYHLRRRKQCANAQKLSEWLEAHPLVERVSYPGLPSHPQHAWFQQHFADFGSMIFFRLKDKQRPLDELITRGQIFQLAASLGATESLITPVLYFFARDLSAEERLKADIDGSAIRLSIGIEGFEDLRGDMERILALP